MKKTVKLTALTVLVLTVFIIGKNLYVERSFCRQSTEALVQLHNINVKMSLHASVPVDQRSGFRNMIKDKAVFLTKLREYGEMKTDLASSLKKVGLSLDELKLSDGSVIPDFSSDGQGVVTGELNASETYEPLPEQTFQIQHWTAKIHGKKEALNSVKNWIKKNENLALVADEISSEGSVVFLEFTTGMIPTMKMPKRVLNIDAVQLPAHVEAKYKLPDFFHYRSCAVGVAEKFNRLKEKMRAESSKNLANLEHADKAKWLWMAYLQSKEFIERAKR